MKLRIGFAKTGKIRFTSHRDMARMWDRGLRRAGVPLAYTQGFSPRPRVSFGLALPTGYQSHAEFLDLELRPDTCDGDAVEVDGGRERTTITVAELPAVLSDVLPKGLDVHAVEPLPTEGRVESLQEVVTSCTWRFEIRGLDPATARAAVTELLAAPTVPVERERKGERVVDDIRPAVHELAVLGPGAHGAELEATLAAKPRVVRPSELVSALAPGHELGLATRTHQWTERHGRRCEPLPHRRAVAAPRAEMHAS